MRQLSLWKTESEDFLECGAEHLPAPKVWLICPRCFPAQTGRPLRLPMRLELQIPDDLAADLARFKPRTLSLPMFCAYLLELGVDRDAKVSAYHVGAGYTGNPETKVQPANEDQKLSLQPSASSSKEPSSPHAFLGGGGVGMEPEEGEEGVGVFQTQPVKKQPASTARSKSVADRPIRENLLKHETLIREFWNVKRGSKSDSAWALLQTELTKIQDAHGDDRLEEQLQLGINGLWKGITMRNFQRFEEPAKSASKEPRHRHPASRVFTASRGFEDGPTTNPVLEELF